MLRKWDKLIRNNKKLAILCGRGHGKSLFFSQIYNIYDMTLYKYRRVIICSASQSQANNLLDESKRIVENNEFLVCKKSEKKWATETIGYNGGFIIAVGAGAEILGQHVDRIIIDDILRSDNKLTDAQIEDYLDMTLDPMLLNRNGQMILVGTPKTEQDIFSNIKHRVKTIDGCPWVIREFPAVIDYEKKILQCPDRFTWAEIMDKRLSMGALKFAREYQLEFFSRDKSLFPKMLIDLAKSKGIEISFTLTDLKKQKPHTMYVIGVDVARSGSVSADFTVATVLEYNTITQEKTIVYVWRKKGLKISEQARQIAMLSRRFGNCMVMVETNNMGQDMIDDLVDDYNVYVEDFTTSGSKKKEELVRFLIKSFEYEKIIFPQGDEATRKVMSVVEDELQKFCVFITPAGNETYKGAGSHDDCVDSLALAVKATQVGGVPFAVTNFGETASGFEVFTRKTDKHETELVKKIRLGLIK